MGGQREFVHAAYTKRKDDDDFGQAGTLVRKVMDDAPRDRLVSNVVGHLKDGVKGPVLSRAFEYWRNIDRAVGDRIAQALEENASPRNNPWPSVARTIKPTEAEAHAAQTLALSPTQSWRGPSSRRRCRGNQYSVRGREAGGPWIRGPQWNRMPPVETCY